MKMNIRRVAQWVKIASVAFFAAFGAYLVTAPFHPQDADKHRGLMAVLPGLLLLLIALLIHVAGGLLNRRENWGLYVQILLSVVAVAVIAKIALG